MAWIAGYAFRDPLKNLPLVQLFVAFIVMDGLVGLLNGVTGVAGWDVVLPPLVLDAVLSAAVVYFYPRGQQAAKSTGVESGSREKTRT